MRSSRSTRPCFDLSTTRSGLPTKEAGFGQSEDASFWIDRASLWIGTSRGSSNVHLAFSCRERGAVDAFYEAALRAGGKDNGAPGIRNDYHRDYYAAFVIDPDGNNVEAVCCIELHHEPDRAAGDE